MVDMLNLRHLVKNARVYDLGQPLEMSTPTSSNHPGFRIALIRRHGDVVRADGGSSANDLFMSGTHMGTHIDALAHISHEGKLFGGADASQAQVGGRFQKLGIDQVEPMVCRGVLLDVAALHGVPSLAAGAAITADDLRRAADRAGVGPEPGDAVLVRSGWSVHWSNTPLYVGQEAGTPGVDTTGAEQVVRWGARVTGHDSAAYEQVPLAGGIRTLPVHRVLLVEHGIHIVENLNLESLARDGVAEFLFVLSPLKIVGATGSPVRPIAIVPG